MVSVDSNRCCPSHTSLQGFYYFFQWYHVYMFWIITARTSVWQNISFCNERRQWTRDIIMLYSVNSLTTRWSVARSPWQWVSNTHCMTKEQICLVWFHSWFLHSKRFTMCQIIHVIYHTYISWGLHPSEGKINLSRPVGDLLLSWLLLGITAQ